MPPEKLQMLLAELAKVMGTATKRLVPDPEEGWRLIRSWGIQDEEIGVPEILDTYTMLVCRMIEGVIEFVFYGRYAEERCMPLINEWAEQHEARVRTTLVHA